jgi:hypothetical protein
LISSEGISSNGPVIPTPALLITISNLPELAMIFCNSLNRVGILTSKVTSGKNEFNTRSGFLLVPYTTKPCDKNSPMAFLFQRSLL